MRKLKMNDTDLILETDVYKWLGMKRTALWRLKKKHEFPLPVLYRPAKYRKSLIQKWLDDGGVNRKK